VAEQRNLRNVIRCAKAQSHWLIVLLIWFFYSVNLVAWELSNQRVVGYDEVCHFGNSVAFWQAYATPWVFLHFWSFLAKLSATQPLCLTIGIYPPLIYAVTGLTYFILPPTLEAAAISNVIFLFILIGSTFKLTEELVGRTAGFVAAFLIGAYPIIVGTTRYYYLDFGVTAIVALTFLLLVKSQRFQNTKIDVLLGFTILAGMLSKDTYPLYVAAPFVYILLKAYPNRRAILNGIGVLAIASMSAAWYLQPGELALLYYYNFVVPLIRGDLSSSLAPLNHLETMVLYGTGFLLFALFCVGLPIILRNPKARVFCSVGLLGGFLVLGFADTRYFDPRFTMPFLPLLAMTSASLFNKTNRHSRARVIALIVVVSLVLGEYASITYNAPMLSGLSWPANSQTMVAVYPPSQDDWKVSEIVRAIGVDASNHQINRPVVVVPVLGAYFDDALFLYYAYVDGVNLTINTNGYLSPADGIRAACTANYVVLRTSSDGSQIIGSVIEQNVALVATWINLHKSNYVALGNYSLPDGSIAHLYRRVTVLDCDNVSASGASSEYSGTSWPNAVDSALRNSQHAKLQKGRDSADLALN
jgi:4-amino-4-deoxy-L-arabinose transferase-like glycosyltransferase